MNKAQTIAEALMFHDSATITVQWTGSERHELGAQTRLWCNMRGRRQK